MATRLAPPPASTDAGYDEDFALWSAEQAAHLRDGRFDLIDWENIAEEIESLGKSDRRAITSHFRTASAHLIKLALSADSNPRRGWWNTVRRAWRDAEALLEDSPSLRREVPQMFTKGWSLAVADAADGLRTPEERTRAAKLPTPPVELAMSVADEVDLLALLP